MYILRAVYADDIVTIYISYMFIKIYWISCENLTDYTAKTTLWKKDIR